MHLPESAKPRIVVMGVSGSGKSSIGILLARTLSLAFTDGDDLHPESNKAKMSAGIPLTDEDRRPWLDLVGFTLVLGDGGVVACSALKREYRERISAAAPGAIFIHLDGTKELLMERLGNRKGHFMPPSLLQSQLDTLQPLRPDENGFSVDVGGAEAEIVELICKALEGYFAKS